MTLKLYSFSEKRLKLKVKSAEGNQQGTFFQFSPPPILNRVESELKDSRPVKTIKKEKYRFHGLITCSVEITCIVTVIMLENMFGKLNQLFLPTGEQRKGNCAVELDCLQVLNISLLKIFIYLFALFKVVTILALTNKNQPTN